MEAAVDLARMSTADKLRLMENLWQNLLQDDSAVVSPSWHADVLQERERLTASGEEAFIDWETAKEQLRKDLA
jgi:hypothetical protein